LLIGGLLIALGVRVTPSDSLPFRFVVAVSLLDTLAIVLLVVLFLRLRGEDASRVLLGAGSVWREVRRGVAYLPLVFGLVIGLGSLVQSLAPWMHNVPENPLQAMLTSPWRVGIFAVVVVLAGGVREEVQRAFILHRFDRDLGGARLGLALFSIAFGLGHLTQGLDAALITAESCSPGNNAIDPGETVTVNFGLSNVGTANTSNLVATLLATGGVASPSGPQNYGALAAGGPQVSRPFTFTALPNCGETLTATLHLQDGATDLGNVSFNFRIGSLTPPITATYSTGNIAVPIPDVSTVDIPITVTDTGVVADVNVKVRLNHTFDGDLVLSLIAPDGTTVLLAQNRGGSGANYGTGANDCSGTHTVFDDSAATAIGAGVAPFAGSFRPESPLSALNGVLTAGTWKLRVTDTAALDVGTVGCVQLEISRQQFACCGVAGTPNLVADGSALIQESCPPINTFIDPGETVSVNLNVKNIGTGPTSNLVGTLVPNANVLAPSGPQTYGALSPLDSVGRNFTFTANGTCGTSITLNLQLQDGATNLGTVSYTLTLGNLVAANQTFTNPTLITIPAPPSTGASTGAPATPYPSNIIVSGVVGTVSKVTVTITGLNHTFPADIDMLLVGPGGQKMLLMSDVGGGTDAVNANVTFDDTAPAIGGTVVSGTFQPTNVGTGDLFPAPAPAGPYPDPQQLSVFNGVNPNGTWSLFVVDDASADVGTISGGWSMTITSVTASCNTACAGAPRIGVSSTLSCSGGNTIAAITISNTGTAAASNVMLTTAKLGAVNGTPLPQNLGNLAPGASVVTNITFSGAPSGVQTLLVGGSQSGGSFTSSRKVNAPNCVVAFWPTQKVNPTLAAWLPAFAVAGN